MKKSSIAIALLGMSLIGAACANGLGTDNTCYPNDIQLKPGQHQNVTCKWATDPQHSDQAVAVTFEQQSGQTVAAHCTFTPAKQSPSDAVSYVVGHKSFDGTFVPVSSSGFDFDAAYNGTDQGNLAFTLNSTTPHPGDQVNCTFSLAQ